MNNCQIQKIILICLTFSNILISPDDVNSYQLDKGFLNSKNKRRNEQVNKLNPKNLLITLEDIQNISNEYNRQENIDKNINTVVNELIIESKIQSEKDNILYADGEVVVKYKNNILKADSLFYNKKTKLVKAKGNIQLKINNQIFQADLFEYDFVKNKGIFKNVKGLINSESIISDFNFDPNSIYKNLSSTIQRIEKDNIIFTPDKVKNWIFSTKLLKVDNNKWASKQALLTNDLLETNQIKLQFNELQVYSSKEKLKFKSKINYLILEDRFVIPFWLGERTVLKKKGSFSAFDFENRWNIGYDKLNKDGYFIGRKFDAIKIKNDLFLKIEPQFLIQRTLKGKTKSFVQKNQSLNSKRVERNISISDYFALESTIQANIKNWDLKITKELNSFDLDKFANSLRTRAELSKEINLFNTTFVNRIFGAYRESIWNGSIGESEIYNGYGWQLDQRKFWKNGSVQKNQIITFGIGHYKAEGLTFSDFAESYKGSIHYEFNQKVPVFEKRIDPEFIDKSFEYIPKPIKQGVFLNSKISASYNSYKNGNSQQYLGIGLGPEITVGNFKKNFFDYTHISIKPFYKFKSGMSLFKFDNISDKFTVDLNFDQQVFGPLLIETKGTINLDKDSDHYGQFINSRIGVNFQKRSYNFGIFYQPHSQAGGIQFILNGFK